uniref:Uncharacterized protein n=1 Tax=Cajanus cajan TaxID=3821 RepID=A0A151R634_CAJCA|nr:hypothetical protein KK1_040767 [Cajanus cajan]
MEDPPSLIASVALIFILKILCLISFPLSESISSLTRSPNSAELTTPFFPSFTANPTFISSTKITLFSLCSAYNGHATMGTPSHTASNTEFHPQ